MNEIYQVLISTTDSRYNVQDDFMFQMISSYTTSQMKYAYQMMSTNNYYPAYAVFLVIGV